VARSEAEELWGEASEGAVEEAVWASSEMAGRLATRAVVDCLRSARHPPFHVWSHEALVERIRNHASYPGHCGATLVKAVGLFVEGNDQARSMKAERQGQADILRDIIGNPFRPVSIDPAWLA